MTAEFSTTSLLDLSPNAQEFLLAVQTGLAQRQRRLPCKYFYDQRGSQLFDEICELDEYYLTRTELDIMERHAAEMASAIDAGVMLIEFGSGSSIKTKLLLDQLDRPAAYVPVDISKKHLHLTANKLSHNYPGLEVLPVCADFTKPFQLPISEQTPTHNAVYFPGSTIGNFTPHAAKALLSQIAQLCGSGGGLLIGVDLQKDVAVIESAYNDAGGVTAQFNLNLLRRINQELGANFALDQFEHSAVYNRAAGRVEIGLRSVCKQNVELAGEVYRFDENEIVLTEYSTKYTINGFAELAAHAGYELHNYWTDENDYFGVLHLVIAAG